MVKKLNMELGQWKYPESSDNKYMNELIETAVNACMQINPNNPLSAAKAIGLLYENLVRILDRIDEGEFKDNFPSAYIRAMNALKEATE